MGHLDLFCLNPLSAFESRVTSCRVDTEGKNLYVSLNSSVPPHQRRTPTFPKERGGDIDHEDSSFTINLGLESALKPRRHESSSFSGPPRTRKWRTPFALRTGLKSTALSDEVEETWGPPLRTSVQMVAGPVPSLFHNCNSPTKRLRHFELAIISHLGRTESLTDVVLALQRLQESVQSKPDDKKKDKFSLKSNAVLKTSRQEPRMTSRGHTNPKEKTKFYLDPRWEPRNSPKSSTTGHYGGKGSLWQV